MAPLAWPLAHGCGNRRGSADLERLVRLDRERAEAFKVIDELREAFKDIPAEEIERATDRIVARIRAENRERVPEAVMSR